MYLRFKLFNHRIVFYNRKVTTVTGIDSPLKDGGHALFFDCDNVNIRELETYCLEIIEKFDLSRIFIVKTGREDSYHLYCFTKQSFRRAVEIVASCPFIDFNFLTFSIQRRHFTLRVLDKLGRSNETVSIVESDIRPNCTWKDFAQKVIYETASNLKGINND